MWKCLCSAQRVLMVNMSEHSGSGSSWAVTCCGCCLRKAEGEIAFTRGTHCIFWELGWAAFVCVWVFFSWNPTAYLACFSVSPFPKLDFVILCSFWLGLMFSHVKCWVSVCTNLHRTWHWCKTYWLGGFSLYETETESEVVLDWCTYVPKITSGL